MRATFGDLDGVVAAQRAKADHVYGWATERELGVAVRRRRGRAVAGGRHHRPRRRRLGRRRQRGAARPTACSTPTRTASSAATSCASACSRPSTPPTSRRTPPRVDWVVDAARRDGRRSRDGRSGRGREAVAVDTLDPTRRDGGDDRPDHDAAGQPREGAAAVGAGGERDDGGDVDAGQERTERRQTGQPVPLEQPLARRPSGPQVVRCTVRRPPRPRGRAPSPPPAAETVPTEHQRDERRALPTRRPRPSGTGGSPATMPAGTTSSTSSQGIAAATNTVR